MDSTNHDMTKKGLSGKEEQYRAVLRRLIRNIEHTWELENMPMMMTPPPAPVCYSMPKSHARECMHSYANVCQLDNQLWSVVFIVRWPSQPHLSIVLGCCGRAVAWWQAPVCWHARPVTPVNHLRRLFTLSRIRTCQQSIGVTLSCHMSGRWPGRHTVVISPPTDRSGD